jgi:hypothetical protein
MNMSTGNPTLSELACHAADGAANTAGAGVWSAAKMGVLVAPSELGAIFKWAGAHL